MALTQEQVFDALKQCYDPEIPVNIVELGLIYDVRVQPATDGKANVEVDFTLTNPGCPSHVHIGNDIRAKVTALPEVADAQINLVWSPPWGPERISPEGRERLGI